MHVFLTLLFFVQLFQNTPTTKQLLTYFDKSNHPLYEYLTWMLQHQVKVCFFHCSFSSYPLHSILVHGFNLQLFCSDIFSVFKMYPLLCACSYLLHSPRPFSLWLWQPLAFVFVFAIKIPFYLASCLAWVVVLILYRLISRYVLSQKFFSGLQGSTKEL